MTEGEPKLRDPWLIAAWPGMGRVAMIAARHLIEKLEGKKVGTVDRPECFEINTVTIESGVVQRPDEPKGEIFAVTTPPEAERDLLIFMGDPQPSYQGFDFCRALIEAGVRRGATRVVTFAAMATGVHPSAPSRVFGVASEEGLLPLLTRHDVGVLSSGQISGLNGVLLAAAAERGVEGICLLGELPGFAYAIPNPKAALAVLRAFERLSGIETDLTALEEQSHAVERGLGELLQKMQAGGQAKKDEDEEPGFLSELKKATGEDVTGAAAEGLLEEKGEAKHGPGAETLAKVEGLFRAAQSDRSQAMALKAELDRLGLYRRFEDRFLDLFRKPSSDRPGAG